MNEKTLSFGGQALTIHYPQQAAEAVELAFAEFPTGNVAAETVIKVIHDPPTGYFSAVIEDQLIGSELDLADLALLLLARAACVFAGHWQRGPALHGAVVHRNGKSLLMPGHLGGEHSLLASWLLMQGCGYLTDRLVCFPEAKHCFLPLPCPLSLNLSDLSLLEPVLHDCLAAHTNSPLLLRGKTNLLFSPRMLTDQPSTESEELSLLLFAERKQDTELAIVPLSPAQAAQQLAGCLANGLVGFPQAAALARQVPALALYYANCSQLENILLPVIDFILTAQCSPQSLRSFITAFADLSAQKSKAGLHSKQQRFPVPAATLRQQRQPKITIGMATYDDYDGVYFSVQALRLYHPEIIDQCEFLIIDNHPDGPCAASLKRFDSWTEQCRYVPLKDVQGTGAARNAVFQHAAGDYVVCMDCHVLLVPGALKRLADYFTTWPDTCDLLQGPLLHDDMRQISTHFEPVWRNGMYGIWAHDPRGDEPTGEPFAIPMQGIGLFACRRDAWPGFNPRFSGFGADEGYIHEKFRQAGGQVLCLPFLRWLHRFARPLGAPYPVRWKDRIHNYLIGFAELGLDIEPIKEHFIGLLGKKEAEAILRELTLEMEQKA
ncbi:glycosyltransferase [Candidatus Electronema sp. PJ]|uniref:glycosyltransferase n=1 Tax=Candidatus Electronema sp. PJ TaxID=3401572 RepID=UPI003AA9150F